MFIFQPSSKIPISPFFFHFKKAKLVWPAAIPYFLSNPSLEEGPTFTASLACGWNRLVAKMGSCGLPNRLRRPNQYFLFICFHLKKKSAYVWFTVVGGKVLLPRQCRWSWVGTWLIAEGLGEFIWDWSPLPPPRLHGRGPGEWNSLLLFIKHLPCIKSILHISSFNSYNYPVSRHYYLHFRAEGGIAIQTGGNKFPKLQQAVCSRTRNQFYLSPMIL